MLGPASHVHAQQAPASRFQASSAPLLFEAVRNNNLTGVKSAVKAGADLTDKDDDGRTALDIALQRGFFDIAQFLIKARQEQLDPPIGRARVTEPTSTASRTVETDNVPPPGPARSREPASPPADAPSSGKLDSEPISVRRLFRNLFGGGEDGEAQPVRTQNEAPKADPRPPAEHAGPDNVQGTRAPDQSAKLNQGDDRRSSAVSRPGPSAQPIKRLRAPLRDAFFTLGKSVSIGQPLPAQGAGKPNACVSKPGRRAFCVVPVDWPGGVEGAFQVNTILYQGARALARYDRGAASRFHVLFRSDQQEKVLAFLKKRYGDPTDEWKRVIAPVGKPPRANPTFAWRSRNTETKLMTILEVRKFDDSRNVFPDTEHGVVRLYVAGGPPVFPAVSALDIMSIDWAARSDHNDAAVPPRANSVPRGR